LDTDTGTSALQFNLNVGWGDTAGLNLQGDEFDLRRYGQRLCLLRSRRHGQVSFGFRNPAAQQVGVEAVGQRHRRRRNSWLFAGSHDLAFEFVAVAATTPTSTGQLDV
jgi:hypothetical protein